VQGRWDRMERRRQWDAEDQENEDRRAALEAQGEYLTSVSKLIPERDDYMDVLDDLIRSNPDMVSDPAVKPLLAFQARRHEDWKGEEEGKVAALKAEETAALKFWSPLKEEAARLGMPEDEFTKYQVSGNSYALHRRLAEMEREMESGKAAVKAAPAQRVKEQDKLLANKNAFPEHSTTQKLLKAEKDSPEMLIAVDFDSGTVAERRERYLQVARSTSEEEFVGQLRGGKADDPKSIANLHEMSAADLAQAEKGRRAFWKSANDEGAAPAAPATPEKAPAPAAQDGLQFNLPKEVPKGHDGSITKITDEPGGKTIGYGYTMDNPGDGFSTLLTEGGPVRIYNGRLAGVGRITAKVKPGTKLDVDTARKFKELAGGDRVKAEKLAREAGYTF